MNKISRFITGIIGILLGCYLLFVAMTKNWWVAFYGTPILLIGVLILFNKKEDQIEQIKNNKK